MIRSWLWLQQAYKFTSELYTYNGLIWCHINYTLINLNSHLFLFLYWFILILVLAYWFYDSVIILITFSKWKTYLFDDSSVYLESFVSALECSAPLCTAKMWIKWALSEPSPRDHM
jgi:hypothetical protein